MTTDASKIAQTTAKGGFHLMYGLVISVVIQTVGTLYIARLLGADNFGLYSIALSAPNLIATFRDWGVNNAMIKYAAQYNREDNKAKIRSVFASITIFEVVAGLVLTILSLALSDYLASTFNRPDIAPMIQIASFTIIIGALTNVALSAFNGLERMHLSSATYIAQSITKTLLTVALVVVGWGTLGAVLGATVATFIAALVGILLLFAIYRTYPKTEIHFVTTIKEMLKYGLPLSIGAILINFMYQFWGWLMAIYITDNAIVGNYNMASTFMILVTFISIPVTTMLLPAFAKLDAKKDAETLKRVFHYSIKYASLLIVPTTIMVMVLSQPAVALIVGDTYSQTPFFLALILISYLYCTIGNLSAGNLINGQGFTAFSLKLSIITAAVGFPLSFLLISQFGIMGLIATSLTAVLPSLFASLIFVKKQFNVTIEWRSSAKILLTSCIAGAVTYTTLSVVALPNIIELIVGFFVFVSSFLALAIATKTINKNDITNITNVAGDRGLLNKVIKRFALVLAKFV